MNCAPDIYISLHNTTLGDEEQSWEQEKEIRESGRASRMIARRWNYNPKIGLDIWIGQQISHKIVKNLSVEAGSTNLRAC